MAVFKQFKVGEKIRVKLYTEIVKFKSRDRTEGIDIWATANRKRIILFNDHMKKFCGKEFIISSRREDSTLGFTFELKTIIGGSVLSWVFTESMLEPISERSNIKPQLLKISNEFEEDLL